MQIFENFKDKKVLITGHTGFKGSWLSIWMKMLGADVYGVSLDIPSSPSHFKTADLSGQVEDLRLDICDAESISALVQKIQPDFVFHLAAQALVRSSYESPVETMMTNAIGSANLLNSLRQLNKPVVSIMITSDKAYDNVEWVWGYRETDRLGGKDPYSASKGMAELAIKSFVESYFSSNNSNVKVGIARAGNVIGGGDWAYDRIVPDCMKSWADNKAVDIRNPMSTRPWQHVLEPLSGYLVLANDLYNDGVNHGQPYNFGPLSDQNHPVKDLINEMGKHWSYVRWNDISESKEHLHEAGLLKLNCEKSMLDLHWQPVLTFEETVKMTVEWYKFFYQNQGESMMDFSTQQIVKYTQLATRRKLQWATR
jgi:CDP-glucose 4,6-dehydratase